MSDDPTDDDLPLPSAAGRIAHRAVGCFMVTLGLLGAGAGGVLTLFIADRWRETGVTVRAAAVVTLFALFLTANTVLALLSGAAHLLNPVSPPRRPAGPGAVRPPETDTCPPPRRPPTTAR